ncbi:hypothetical protein B0A55_13796, partial [Friedmanniomyces simplex]
NAEAKRRQALDDESEAKRKQLLHDEVDAKRKQILDDEIEARKRAREEEEMQAMREVDARIEAEARERAAEEKKAGDLRRQTQAQKEVLRQHVQAKKDVEAAWAQRMLDQAEAKKRAREREIRGWREAEEAKKAGDEARRKQQEVRDAVAKRFAGSGSTPTIPIYGGEASSVPQSRPATRDDELAKIPKAYAEPAGQTTVERTDAKVLPATNAHATTTAGREAAASAASTGADKSKQDRVRALKDRNARYELDAETGDRSELTDANERRTEPTRQGQTGGATGGRYENTRHEPARSKEDGFAPLPVKPRPSGPMSLNGFVEQAALHRPNGSNDGRLHEITATDVTMIKLKRSGLPWNDVCIALRKATGIQESHTALTKRWTLLKGMLTSSDGPGPLLQLDKGTEGVTLEQLKDWMQ